MDSLLGADTIIRDEGPTANLAVIALPLPMRTPVFNYGTGRATVRAFYLSHTTTPL